jgi:hypothetical protein
MEIEYEEHYRLARAAWSSIVQMYTPCILHSEVQNFSAKC